MDQDSHRAESPFRVIPVLDLKGGQAVHARGGNRRSYRGVVSRLCRGSDPVNLALAFRDRLGLRSLYVADLDAIEDDRPDWPTLTRLARLGLDLWVDVGARGPSRAAELAEAGVASVILATETLAGPGVLDESVRRIGAERVVFGLDLRDGRTRVADGSGWGDDDPVGRALSAGVRRVLVIDVARVGTGSGVGTFGLARALRKRFGPIEVTVGGGVASLSDLHAARDAGASAVLVGSALHDGRLTAEDLGLLTGRAD